MSAESRSLPDDRQTTLQFQEERGPGLWSPSGGRTVRPSQGALRPPAATAWQVRIRYSPAVADCKLLILKPNFGGEGGIRTPVPVTGPFDSAKGLAQGRQDAREAPTLRRPRQMAGQKEKPACAGFRLACHERTPDRLRRSGVSRMADREADIPPKLACDPRERRRMAEREGFEPPCRLPDKTLSRRPRYDHFGTSPFFIRSRSPLRGDCRPTFAIHPREGCLAVASAKAGSARLGLARLAARSGTPSVRGVAG